MKNPTVEEILGNENYQMLHKLHYDSIIGFVFKNIKKKTLGSAVYLLSLVILIILILIVSIQAFSTYSMSFKEYILAFSCGFIIGSFLIIPFHEIIHALAYRLVGARKPRFGVDFKQLIFYVAADKFVVGRIEFYWVALAPFIIINLIISSVFVFLNIHYQLIALYFLFFHNLMCIGDFAMISFFHLHPKKKLFTFDILKEKTSYIYEYKEQIDN